MEPTEAVKTVLAKYATFTGRAARPELWWYVLFIFLLNIGLAIIEGAVLAPILGFDAFSKDAGQPLRVISSLIFLLPSMAVMVRRLHDIDRSAWWYLIIFVPVIGVLLLIFWATMPGTEGSNQYGE
ncbi:MAG: DUF805 domain-containing protein [Halioglobus sp.]